MRNCKTDLCNHRHVTWTIAKLRNRENVLKPLAIILLCVAEKGLPQKVFLVGFTGYLWTPGFLPTSFRLHWPTNGVALIYWTHQFRYCQRGSCYSIIRRFVFIHELQRLPRTFGLFKPRVDLIMVPPFFCYRCHVVFLSVLSSLFCKSIWRKYQPVEQF